MKGYTIDFKSLCTDSQFQEPATGDVDIITLREREALGFFEIENLRVGVFVIRFIGQTDDNPSVLYSLGGEPFQKTMVIFTRCYHRHLHPFTTGTTFWSEPIERPSEQKPTV